MCSNSITERKGGKIKFLKWMWVFNSSRNSRLLLLMRLCIVTSPGVASMRTTSFQFHTSSKERFRSHPSRYLMHPLYRTIITLIWWTGQLKIHLLWGLGRACICGTLPPVKWQNCTIWVLKSRLPVWAGATQGATSQWEQAQAFCKTGTFKSKRLLESAVGMTVE